MAAEGCLSVPKDDTVVLLGGPPYRSFASPTPIIFQLKKKNTVQAKGNAFVW